MRDEVVGLGDQPMMRLECAWCGLVLADGAGPVTHGICSVCEQYVDVAQPFTDPVTQRQIALVPVVSHTVAAAGWRADGTAGVAIVRFTSRAIYRYAQVPLVWWLSFLAAERKGRHLAMTLGAEPARFPCARIADHAALAQGDGDPGEEFPDGETLADA